jgi:hypothetical protein
MKLIYILFFIIGLNNVVMASPHDARYEVQICGANESVLDLAKSNFSQVSHRFQKVEHYRDEIVAWNLHISGLNNDYICKGGERFYVEYPFPYFLGYAYAPMLPQDDSVERVIGKKFSFMAFYAASAGKFNEDNSTNATSVNFDQNSPITFGLLTNLRYDSGKSFSLSAYISKINTANTNVESQTDLSIPWEKGTSLYYEHRLGIGNFFLYGGHDYESFTTFNSATLVNSATIDLVENKIHYGTLGLTSIFGMGSSSLLVKASLSQIFSSDNNVEGFTPYKGIKGIIFCSLIDGKKITYNLFYKRHQLESADNKLNINRYGIGLGYRFF